MTGIATIHANLRAAFRQKLGTVSGLPAQIAWEGRPFTPTIGQAFMRESFRPIYSQPRAIGVGGTIQHRMTGNLTLFYPAGKGTVEIEQAAGAILAAFAPGTSLTYGGASCVVLQAERAPLLQEADYIGCPVTITLQAYTAN